MSQDFYFINWAQKKSEVILQPVDEYDEKKLIVKQFIPQLPFKTRVAKGSKFYDVAYFADPFNFSISEKLNNVLLENGFTGWDTYPIEIEGSDAKYFGFRVLGKSGPIIKPATTGFVKGYHFDVKSWDKSDFFCPEGTLHVFFTGKVKSALDKNKITNLAAVNPDEYEWYNAGKS